MPISAKIRPTVPEVTEYQIIAAREFNITLRNPHITPDGRIIVKYMRELVAIDRDGYVYADSDDMFDVAWRMRHDGGSGVAQPHLMHTGYSETPSDIINVEDCYA